MKLFAFPAVCCGVVLVAVRLVCFFLGGWEGALGERHVLCQSIPTARVGSAGLSEKRVRLHAELQPRRVGVPSTALHDALRHWTA